MKIHISAKFSSSKFGFHDEFELNATENQIEESKEKVKNFAIQKFKQKCDEYFRVDFALMVFFEVYYFNKQKEITIFKKKKKYEIFHN